MSKMITIGLLVLVASSASMAATWSFINVPEIDPTSGVAAMALLAGAVVVIRGFRKR
jgi:hypothetical protein